MCTEHRDSDEIMSGCSFFIHLQTETLLFKQIPYFSVYLQRVREGAERLGCGFGGFGPSTGSHVAECRFRPRSAASGARAAPGPALESEGTHFATPLALSQDL